MAELDVGGVKLKGGKGLTILIAIGTVVSSLYGGFVMYKDYMDMKEKLAGLDTGAIEAQLETSMIKLDEAIDYAKDIKDDLRSDVIQVEKALGQVENRIRQVESENRETIQEAKAHFESKTEKVEDEIIAAKEYFSDKTMDMDEKFIQLEERINKKLERALDNPLLKEMGQ